MRAKIGIMLGLKYLIGLQLLYGAQGKMFQVVPFQSFIDGNYQGVYSIEKLKNQGDFGVGALANLEGELVIYNGEFWVADAKTKLKKAKKKQQIPFACVSRFKSEYTYKIKNVRNFQQLEKLIQDYAGTPNNPVAILIKGHYSFVKIRGFKPQDLPHRPLNEVIKEQNVYHLVNENNGITVGYWVPQYWNKILPEGLHLHYMNEKKSRGGHILDMHIGSAEIYIQPMENIEIFVPLTEDFEKLKL